MFPQLFMPSITLFLLGLALRVSLRLMYGARGPSPNDAVHLFMRTMSWILLILPTVVFFIASLHPVTLLMGAAVFEAIVELAVARRQAHRESAWRLLLMAIGGQQPLAESLRYHQSRFRGIVGRWYRRLVADLEQGAPLVEAVWANRRALPREAPVYASLIASSPAPAEEAASFSELDSPAFVELQQHSFQRFIYLSTVAWITFLVLLFVMLKIIPSYQEIFQDFDIELPRLTTNFIGFSLQFGWLLAIPAVFIFIVFAGGAFVVGFLYLLDVPALRPLLDRVGFSRHRAHILRLLAAAIDQGAPLSQSLEHLQDPRFGYPSRLARRRLTETTARIDAGHEWTKALRRSSLVSETDAAVLRTAQHAGNLSWAMRMLADRKIRQMTFHWAVLENIIFATTILLLGLFIFWYAVAMFYPLTQIIWNLT